MSGRQNRHLNSHLRNREKELEAQQRELNRQIEALEKQVREAPVHLLAEIEEERAVLEERAHVDPGRPNLPATLLDKRFPGVEVDNRPRRPLRVTLHARKRKAQVRFLLLLALVAGAVGILLQVIKHLPAM